MLLSITNTTHQPISITDEIVIDPQSTRVVDVEINDKIQHLSRMGILRYSEATAVKQSASNISRDDFLKKAVETALKKKKTTPANSKK